VDDTVDFIFYIFYSKNTMDYTVYIDCLHYGSHCRCLDEQGGVVFSIFYSKSYCNVLGQGIAARHKTLGFDMVTLGSGLVARSKAIGYGCNAKPKTIVSNMAAKSIFLK